MKVSFSQRRRVHLASEMAVPGGVGNEGRCRFGVRRGGQDQARAAGLLCEGRCHDQPII
jgi:hypothetical protein